MRVYSNNCKISAINFSLSSSSVSFNGTLVSNKQTSKLTSISLSSILRSRYQFTWGVKVERAVKGNPQMQYKCMIIDCVVLCVKYVMTIIISVFSVCVYC